MKIINIKMMKVSIGCSGFHYKHWRGNFYPEKLAVKKWFEYYSQYFNTLELNVTFYRFPQLSMLKNWYTKSPDTFLFAVKAPRAITHFKKFLGTTELIQDFYKTVDQGLQHKLACVLFQLPPRFVYTEEHLKRIVDSLDPAYQNVVEFRHSSWWTEEVYKSLGERNITFCGMSHPDFPDEVITNTPFLYYRMHGLTQLYSSEYSDQELDEFASKLKSNPLITEARVYFNNDIQGYAVTNALSLIKRFP